MSKASIYLLPSAGREGTTDFPYGVHVRLYGYGELGVPYWNFIGDVEGLQRGHFSLYGLCVAYNHNGWGVVWGLFPLRDRRPRPGLEPRNLPLTIGTFKRVELTGDLAISQSQSQSH